MNREQTSCDLVVAMEFRREREFFNTVHANEVDVTDYPDILALPADLMFASRIRGAAQAVGQDVFVAPRPAALLDAARSRRPRLILVDLDAPGWDAVGVVRDLKGDDRTAASRVIAFVRHTNQAAIEGARAAGADRVMARSAFVQELAGLLTPEE